MRSDYKRPPLLSRGQRTALITLLVLIALILLNAGYRSLQAPRWSEEARITDEIRQKAVLSSVDEVRKYIWDRTVWVVRGTAASGEQVYLWYADAAVIGTIPVSEGQTAERMRARLLARYPDARMSHAIAGIWNGTPAWELLFSRTENGQRRYFYHFYDFRSGDLLEIYTLPSK